MLEDVIITTNNNKIKIYSLILSTLHNFIQPTFFSVESGGILIGKENFSNNNIIINALTTPMKKDKRTYNKFIRKDSKHIEIFNCMYKNSNNVLRYIGEWHSHHQAIPQYSCIDYENWKKIKENSPVQNNYYHIITGYKAIRIWIYEGETDNIDLQATLYWSDIIKNEKDKTDINRLS